MKFILAAALLATTVAGVASAQTADFRCPAKGTQFTLKAATFEKVNTATGRDGDVCLFDSVSDGKTEPLRVHWGLIGSVDAQGEAFTKGLDLKALWPLKVGNRITNTVTLVGRDGKTYTSTVTVVVAAYEKVTVPAGTFDAFRVEDGKAGERPQSIRWWAPALAYTIQESFPDWRDRSKTMVLELTAVKAASR